MLTMQKGRQPSATLKPITARPEADDIEYFWGLEGRMPFYGCMACMVTLEQAETVGEALSLQLLGSIAARRPPIFRMLIRSTISFQYGPSQSSMTMPAMETLVAHMSSRSALSVLHVVAAATSTVDQ